MKILQNFAVTAIILTGVFLPMTSASAFDEPSYFVPIQPCRLFDTRAIGKTPDFSGTSTPFVADDIRILDALMYDTKFFVITDLGGTGVLNAIGAQGGSADYESETKSICDIPSNALAIHVNLIITQAHGKVSYMRAWPYAGTEEGDDDFSTANVMVWDGGSVISNATPLTLANDTGFRFTLRVFFQVASDPTHPENFSAHVTGDALGYYLPFIP